MFPDLTSEEPTIDPAELDAVRRWQQRQGEWAVLLAFAQQALPSFPGACTCTAQEPGTCLPCLTAEIVARNAHALLARG